MPDCSGHGRKYSTLKECAECLTQASCKKTLWDYCFARYYNTKNPVCTLCDRSDECSSLCKDAIDPKHRNFTIVAKRVADIESAPANERPKIERPAASVSFQAQNTELGQLVALLKSRAVTRDGIYASMLQKKRKTKKRIAAIDSMLAGLAAVSPIMEDPGTGIMFIN